MSLSEACTHSRAFLNFDHDWSVIFSSLFPHSTVQRLVKTPWCSAGSTGSIDDGSCLATRQGLSWVLQSWKQEIPLLNTKCFLRIINATHNTNDWRIRSRQWLFLSTVTNTWFSCQEKFCSFVGTGCNFTKLLSDCSLRVKAAKCRSLF